MRRLFARLLAASQRFRRHRAQVPTDAVDVYREVIGPTSKASRGLARSANEDLVMKEMERRRNAGDRERRRR